LLKYVYDAERITITEKAYDKDTEIWIRPRDSDSSAILLLREIRDYFDSNRVHTDVLLYPHKNNEYQWIVRNDYYVDFILALFKHRLIESVTWTESSDERK